jgi:hypothetical protein
MKWLAGIVAVPVILILSLASLANTSYPPAAGTQPIAGGQETFAESLAMLPFCLPAPDASTCGDMGIDVARAWAVAEGGGVNTGQPADNFLFESCVPGVGSGCASLAGRDWATFAAPADAAEAVWITLQGASYAGVVSAIATGAGDAAVLMAIASSPWDAGHYAGASGVVGENLFRAYDDVVGATGCVHNVACVP